MWLQGTDALIDDLRQGSDASVDRQPQKQLEELELAQELTVADGPPAHPRWTGNPLQFLTSGSAKMPFRGAGKLFWLQ